MLWALLLAFGITDTTDNDTKQRSILALALPKEKDGPLLMLECEGGGAPRLSLEFWDVPLADWVVVAAEDDHADGSAQFVFQKAEIPSSRLTYFGNANDIMKGVQDHYTMAFTAFAPGRKQSASYSMEGLSKAWARIRQACPLTE